MITASVSSAVVVCKRMDGQGGMFVTKFISDYDADIQALKLLNGENFCIDMFSWFEVEYLDFYHFGMYIPYYRRTLNDRILEKSTMDVRKMMVQLFTVSNLSF